MSNARGTHEPSWALYGAFLAVMQHGSLSGASRALGVAQPTTRRQIEALERELGAVLFTRAPNGLTPTALAHATLPHAEAIAASARAFVRAASAHVEDDAGTVRITASEMVGAEVLPALLTRLHETHPRLSIELVLDDRNQDLLRREADVAVRMIAPTQRGLVQRRVAQVELGLFASASYVARRGVPRAGESLAAHSWIGPDRGRRALEAMARAGVELEPRALTLRTDSSLAQLAAVRAGLGIGVVQVPLAARPTPLVRVLPKVRFGLEAWLVTHEDLRGVARVRVVMEHLARGLEAYAATTPEPLETPHTTQRGSNRGGARARRGTARRA